MKAKIRAVASRPLVRYLMVGGSVYLFELVVIAVAQQQGASPVVAVGLSFCLGLIVSFVLQKFVTFKDKRMHQKVIMMQVVAVGILVVFNFGFTLAVTKLLTPYFPAYVTRTLALGITTVWNYRLYKTRIFRQNETMFLVD